MYETGSFITYNKTLPGVYSKIEDTNRTRYTAPFGGVTIPVTVISHSPDAEWPKDAIEVTRSNKLLVFDQYTIERRKNVEQMVDETLRNAARVFLIPFDGVGKEIKNSIKAVSAFGKGAYSSVEAWVGNDRMEDNTLFEILTGVRVVLLYVNENTVSFQFYSPDGCDCLANSKQFSNTTETKHYYDVQDGELKTATITTAVYGTTPSVTYNGVKFNIYLHEKFSNGYKDEFVLFGGSGKYGHLQNTTNQKVTDRAIEQGDYVACNMKVDTSQTGNKGKVKRQYVNGEENGYFMYVKSTTGYAGEHSGYYLDIYHAKADLVYIDAAANVYPAFTKTVQSHTIGNGVTTIEDVIGLFKEIHKEKYGTKDIDNTKDTIKCGIPADGARVIIGFSPIFERISETTRFDNFMRGSGTTNADILYYPNWSDEVAERDFTTCKDKYRAIQKWYLDKRSDKCNLTQLLMDESLMKEGRDWLTGEPMTLNNPFLISLKSGKGNKSASQRIGAFTAGLLTACGAFRSATAQRYEGDAPLILYDQDKIEDMFLNGVMAYHEHFNQKVLYVDQSAYVKEKAGADAQIYPKAFERNMTVRAVNMFTFQANRMFFFNYMSQPQEGSTAQMIQHDLFALIESMSEQKAFELPNSSDVTVKQRTPESYIAEVFLRMRGAPEILYITIGL